MSQLQSSGAISLNDLHQNVGGTSGTTCSLGDTDITNLGFKSGTDQRSLSEYYGLFYHKNTITFNSSSAEWAVSYYFTTYYGVTGWSDHKWEVGQQQTGDAYTPGYSAEPGPAMGSVVPNTEYGRSIRINGGSLMVIDGIITSQAVGYTGGPDFIGLMYVIEGKGNPGVGNGGRNAQAGNNPNVYNHEISIGGNGGTWSPSSSVTYTQSPIISNLTANAPSLSGNNFTSTGRITANVAGNGYRNAPGGGAFNGPSGTVDNHLATTLWPWSSVLEVQKHSYSTPPFQSEDYSTANTETNMFPTSGQVTVTFT